MKRKEFGLDEMGSVIKIKNLSKDLSIILSDYENWDVKMDKVLKWINQFDKVGATKKEMIIILEELVRIFKITYFSRKKIIECIKIILQENTNSNISFLDMLRFRKSDKYKSSSQSDYIKLIKSIDKSIKINNFKADILVYFDDYIISGNSIKQDLDYLLEKNVLSKTYFYFLAITTSGLYQVEREYNYKKLVRFFEFENRLFYKNKSNILWPYENEIDICKNFDYSNMTFRAGFEKSSLFEEDERKKLLEYYFWKAGCYILNKTSGSALLPLGAGYPKTVGSGIITATYINIPNNAPICLWWGDERENNYWFPLLKRKTNKKQYEENKDIDE